MKLLLDTHTFLWWAGEPERLPKKVLATCQNRANSLILSVVSAWEMQIKIQFGRLTLNTTLESFIERQKATKRFRNHTY